jgi:ComF family protein
MPETKPTDRNTRTNGQAGGPRPGALARLHAAASDGLDVVLPPMLAPVQPGGTQAHWQPDSPTAYCPRCGASAGPGSVLPAGCPFCREETLRWDRLTRLSADREPMASWIRAMKYGGQWGWGPWLGRQLAEVLDAPPGDRVAVCPVPLHWRRRIGRGYNQAWLMARALTNARDWTLAPLLKRVRYRQPQSALSATARAKHARNAFAIRPVDLTGWQIVVVDDVKTTGATLGDCAKLLRRQNAAGVQVAIAAVADPKGQDFQSV